MDQHTTEGSTMGIEYARVTNEPKKVPAIERLMTADEVAAKALHLDKVLALAGWHTDLFWGLRPEHQRECIRRIKQRVHAEDLPR